MSIRVVYVEKYFRTFFRSKCIKLVVVPREKPVPQRPDQNERGHRVRYNIFYINIVTKQITETFSILFRGLDIVGPKPESVFARKPG